MVKRRPSPRASTSRPPPDRVRNLLLASLPAPDYQRIAPALDLVPLRLKDVLYKPGQRIDYVYFPGGGFCSVLTVLEDGRMVEVATIGREGMLGSRAGFGGPPDSSMTMVQGQADVCYRMTAAAFRKEMERHGAFYSLLIEYSQAVVGFIMQSTACNAVHSIEQRLARWILMAQDRMERRDFPLTQEFVAMMLGASRPTVTVVAGTLQKAGLITYHRGLLTVIDRENLEAASCECYRVATQMLLAVTARRL